MPRSDTNDLPIFTRWMQFLQWLLPTTEKFARFTVQFVQLLFGEIQINHF